MLSSSHIINLVQSNMLSTLIFFLVVSSLVPPLFKLINKLCSNILANKRNSIAPTTPPGPKPWPIVGCLPEMVRNRPTSRWIHKILAKMNTEIACIKLGNVHVIVVTSPELSCEFLKTQDHVFSSRPEVESGRLASGGYLSTVLSPVGEQWKKMKNIIKSEVLSPMRHNWLLNKRNMEADHLVHFMYINCSKGGIINVRDIGRYYCGNVMRRIIFNKRFFIENDLTKQHKYDNAIFAATENLYAFDISDYLPWLGSSDFFGHKKKIKEALDCINNYHNAEIDERIRLWMSGSKVEEEDILDVLIRLKGKDGKPILTEQEIKAQLSELVLAGVDNPANAIEWALAEMLNQPEILKRAEEELDIVVGQGRLVQESDLPQLNYITACAKEAMRLHPVASFNMPHVSTMDTIVGGYFIPKGSHVLLSRPGLGRNPRVWQDPLKFKPERHLNDDGSKVMLSDNGLRMLSFSTGRRGCIALTLGSTMTCMLFARLIQCFTWSALPNVQSIDLSESHYSLYLKEPLLAVAKPRLADDLYRV